MAAFGALPIWCLSFCISHGYSCPTESKPSFICVKSSPIVVFWSKGTWVMDQAHAIAESVRTSQRPSLEIEVFFLTHGRCSKIYIIIPVMFSLAFLAAILIDSDVCRLALAAAARFVPVASQRIFFFYLCSGRSYCSAHFSLSSIRATVTATVATTTTMTTTYDARTVIKAYVN